jgi:hypothetical protein
MIEQFWVFDSVTYPFVVALATSVSINIVFADKYFSFKEGYDFLRYACSHFRSENAKLEDEIEKLKSNVKGKEKK